MHDKTSSFEPLKGPVIAQKSEASLGRLGPHLTVLRPLPNSAFEAIGPFVFIDHLGPIYPLEEHIPPHPHAGIEVLTYLIQGWNEHRDSFGHEGALWSGGVQWITAGRGILHAETAASLDDEPFQGLQIWSRLPRSAQDCEPRYRAVKSSEVPEFRSGGVTVRLLSGNLRPIIAESGPVVLEQASFLAHIKLEPDSHIELPLPSIAELGLYMIGGSLRLNGETLEKADVAILTHLHKALISNRASEIAEVLLLGGDRAERPIVFKGSYVYASAEDAARAHQRFLRGEMGDLYE